MTFLVFLGRFLDASNKKRVEIRLWCVCVWLPCFPSGPIGSILGPKKITFGRHELLGLGNFSTSLLHVSAWAFLEDVFSDMPCRSMGVSVGGSELAVVSALQWSIVVFLLQGGGCAFAYVNACLGGFCVARSGVFGQRLRSVCPSLGCFLLWFRVSCTQVGLFGMYQAVCLLLHLLRALRVFKARFSCCACGFFLCLYEN